MHSFEGSIVHLSGTPGQVELSPATNAESVFRIYEKRLPTSESFVVTEKLKEEWILQRLQMEDKEATPKEILKEPENLLQQIKDAKVSHGRWVAVVLPKSEQVLFAIVKTKDTGYILSSLEYALEPKKLLSFRSLRDTAEKKTYIVNDKTPGHLRERILSSLLWCQEDPENSGYWLATHEGYYQVTEKTLETLAEIQGWVQTSIASPNPDENLLSWQLKLCEKLHQLWGPLNFPIDPVKDQDRFVLSEK